MANKAQKGLDILNGWDFKYDKEKPQGSVMEAWEFAIATYMHETKVEDVRLRRSILSPPASEEFLYKNIANWAKEEDTREEYCLVYELKTENTCQELMAFTLGKAVEDLEERLGSYND